MDSLSDKKVLFVITKSNWGGAQSYVYQLAKAYAEQGNTVMVAFGGTGNKNAETGMLAERLSEAHIPYHFLSSFTRDISAVGDSAAFFELRELLKKERPDVVHLNSSKAGGVGALAARLEHVPTIIFTAHGWAHREPRPFLKKCVIRLSSWVTIFLCDVVIVVSTRDYKDAPVLFSHKKIRLIHNGIREVPTLPREDARRTLSTIHTPLPATTIWILMLAELHTNKGIDTAIRAHKMLIEHKPDTVLVIMGEGEERPHLAQLIHDLGLSQHVFLVGFVTEPRIYLRSGDIFFMPSRKEGLPFALLEAGSVSLPVVASNVGGIPEIIENGVSGLLIPDGDVEGFAAALASLIENPELRSRLGTNLHDRVHREFSESAMIEKTFALY